MDEKAKKILSWLQAQCARREYCSQSMYDKALKALDGDAVSAAEILQSLLSGGFVDDERFCSAFAREKSSLSGWGPVKISFALRSKKISSEAIEAGLAAIEQDRASDKLERLLLSKWKTLEGDPQAKLKLLKFALSRGYEYDSVREMVDMIASQTI
ncbi:MAG: RecX family transcriptional regulator [Bacteroidales bacterium]|nr:RecX family transcriptional regulator [Bacteroidales bacterium]